MWATNNLLAELPDGIMYEHPVLQQGFQLVEKVLCAKTTITLLLGILGAILLRKSFLGRQGTVSAGKAVLRCTSCGRSESDGIKLKECDGCDLVRYCSDECLQDHRPEHAVKCKERAAEMREEILFRQPESIHLGDCPICFLPIPIDPKKFTFMGCCSKIVCAGCFYANQKRVREEKLDPTCPFCRQSTQNTLEESKKNVMKRVERNDPVALRLMGMQYYREQDHGTACENHYSDLEHFKYTSLAAELGDADSHYNLSVLIWEGKGDKKKERYHLEEAAIAGHPFARYNLAYLEACQGRFDRAVKHFIIAANLGHDESIQALKYAYKDELVSKDDFAAALRAHQAAVDATKSPQREVGEKAMAAVYKSKGSSAGY